MKLLTLFFVLFAFYSFSQVETVRRVEFDLKDGYYGESIYEFGENGFLLLANTKASNGEINWKFDKYNTDLDFVKSLELTLTKDYYKDETYRDDEHLYLLFKNRRGEYQVVRYSIKTDSFDKIDGSLERKAYIKDMVVYNDYAYFSSSKKSIPHVMTLNLKTGIQNYRPIEIEGISSRKLSIVNMQILEESNEVFLMVKAYISKTVSKMYIVRMNDKGEIKDYYDFSENAEYRINSLTASTLGEGNYIFTGTYSSKNKSTSNGMYFALISDHKVESINYYDFLDLENFLNYLPEKRQEKIEKKKSKKEDKGKDFVISYWLATHNIIKLDDGYLFLAEAYYPTYRTESRTTTTFVNGVATTTTTYVQVFDGYQYTHAFFAKFNLQGEKVWDESFKMWMAYKPYYVKRFINIAEQSQDAIKLVFASGNRIASKSFDFNGNIVSDEESDEIDSGKEGDKAKYSFSNISYWYDNYFIAYGSQTIKNKEEDVKKRTVYFINKIAY